MSSSSKTIKNTNDKYTKRSLKSSVSSSNQNKPSQTDANNSHTANIQRVQSDSNDVFDNLSDMDLDSNDDEFQLVKHKRQHNSLSTSNSPEIIKKNKTNFVSQNRYNALTNTENVIPTQNVTNAENNTENEQTQSIPPPPPIFVSNIDNFFTFRNDLIHLIGTQNFTFKSTAKNYEL